MTRVSAGELKESVREREGMGEEEDRERKREKG